MWVNELLMSVLPPLSEATDDPPGAAPRILGRRGRHFVLNVQHWLVPSACVEVTGASAIHEAADAVDQVSRVSVIGPALRLSLLVVEVCTFAVLADGLDAQHKDAVGRCEGLAFDLLYRTFEQLHKDPTPYGAAYVEQLCSLRAHVESVLEEVESTFFTTSVEDMMAGGVVHGWERRLKDVHDNQFSPNAHGAVGRKVAPVHGDVGALMRQVSELGRYAAGSIPVDPDQILYKVGWRPPVLDGDHVPGVDKHDRVEFSILSILDGYAHGEATEAPRVGLYGIGSCGKSTACAEVATCEQVRTLFPQGTVWMQLNDTSTSETVASAVLALVYHLCGKAAAKRCQRLARHKDFVSLAASDVRASFMADASKCLVSIDDVRSEQVDMLKQLLMVVPRAAPVLFTTRSEMVVALVTGAVRLAIRCWPEDDARALLTRAVGKRQKTKHDPALSAKEETAGVRRALDLTQCHVLSVSIVAALLSARSGVWRPGVAAMEQQWTDPSFQRPLTRLNPRRSVRATLDTSLVLLPDDDYRRAFTALGILPANELIGLRVLDRLWRPQICVVCGASEGGCLSRSQWPCVEDKAVHPGVLRLVDALGRAGLLHQEVADGVVVGVIVHPVVCGYAHSVLGEDVVATHQRLMNEYARDCPSDDTDTHVWLGYHFWTTADDGYWYNNVARHAAASEDVLALASLVTGEWYAARARTGSTVGHQADVGLVMSSLRAIVDDADHWAHDSPVLLGAAHWGLAMALLRRMGYKTAADQEAAIILLQRVLDGVSRGAAPLLRAEMLNDLGNVYSSRVTGDKVARFQKAVRCYYHALEVWMQRTLAWAETQHCLGMAYADRDGGDKAANVEEALAYFRRALDVRTRDAAPLQWADTNLQIGTAYAKRFVGGKAANMDEALAYYRRALGVWTPETGPLQWAVTQHSMERVYTERVDGDKANLACAVACYQRALEVWTRETVPLQWASTQLTLADAYRRRMGCDKDAKQHIKEMLACYRGALELKTQETAPHAWAETQNRMNNAYSQAVDGDRAANFEEAVVCYQRALNVWTRETAPVSWATTQVRLANLYKQLVGDDKEANEAKMEQMKAYFRCALEVWTRESAPTSWAKTLSSMGKACMRWADGDKAANMDEAVACCRRVLEVWTRETAPQQWATTQLNLAFSLRRCTSSDAGASMEEALACYRYALEVATREHDAMVWARVQFSMGTAYAERVYGDKVVNWEDAVACYRRAFEVRTRKATPQLWATTTWWMMVALHGGGYWAEALDRARALQAFGSKWVWWDETEAALVTRVAQLEREVEYPPSRAPSAILYLALTTAFWAHDYPHGAAVWARSTATSVEVEVWWWGA